jgi:hypothetical protein
LPDQVFPKSPNPIDRASKRWANKSSPGRPALIFKESCVMSDPKLGFEMWGIRLNAEGTLAICAALVLVLAVLAFYRF